MRCLVVHAHPDPESFNAALFTRVCRGLESAGHRVDTIDLYRSGFEPCLSESEHRHYDRLVTEHRAGGAEGRVLDPVVAEHMELVGRAEALVFVYPTWWSGLPAVMKGWLERVMLPDFAFTLSDKGVRPALTGVRRLVGVTTYGSGRLEVAVLGDAGRRTICRAVRVLCGWRCRTTWLGLHRLDTASDDERRDFLDRVERTMAAL